MQVLWWLVPPIVATALAMVWVGIVGRNRDGARREDSDAAMTKLQAALERPAPRTSVTTAQSDRTERSHGVAVRRPTTRTGTDG